MVVEMQRGCIGFVFWIPDGAIASPDHKELRIILIWTGIIYKNIIQNVGKYADIIISLLIFYVLNIYPGNTNARPHTIPGSSRYLFNNRIPPTLFRFSNCEGRW